MIILSITTKVFHSQVCSTQQLPDDIAVPIHRSMKNTPLRFELRRIVESYGFHPDRDRHKIIAILRHTATRKLEENSATRDEPPRTLEDHLLAAMPNELSGIDALFHDLTDQTDISLIAKTLYGIEDLTGEFNAISDLQRANPDESPEMEVQRNVSITALSAIEIAYVLAARNNQDSRHRVERPLFAEFERLEFLGNELFEAVQEN